MSTGAAIKLKRIEEARMMGDWQATQVEVGSSSSVKGHDEIGCQADQKVQNQSSFKWFSSRRQTLDTSASIASIGSPENQPNENSEIRDLPSQLPADRRATCILLFRQRAQQLSRCNPTSIDVSSNWSSSGDTDGGGGGCSIEPIPFDQQNVHEEQRATSPDSSGLKLTRIGLADESIVGELMKTERQSKVINKFRKKSIATYFHESVCSGDRSWQTDLLNYEAEMSDFEDEGSEHEERGMGDDGGNYSERDRMKRRKIGTPEVNYRVDIKQNKAMEGGRDLALMSFERLNEQATGGFGDKGSRYHASPARDVTTRSRQISTSSRLLVIPPKQLAHQPSFELLQDPPTTGASTNSATVDGCNPNYGSKPYLNECKNERVSFNQSDHRVKISLHGHDKCNTQDSVCETTTTTLSASENTTITQDEGSYHCTNFRGSKAHKQSRISHSQPLSNAELLHLSSSSSSNTDHPSSATTTNNESNYTSVSSDNYESVSSTRCIRLAGNRNISSLSRGSQTGSIRLLVDDLKFVVERNLVATLIAMYIFISLAVMITLMLPYFFDLQQSLPSATNSMLQQASSELVSSASRVFADQQQQRHGNPLATVPATTGQLQDSRGLEKSVAVPTNHQRFNGTRLSSSPIGVQSVSGSRQPAKLVVRDDSSTQNQSNVPNLADQHVRPSRHETMTISKQRPPMRPDQKNRVENSKVQATDSNDFKLMWQTIHPRRCQPMTIPMCSKTIGSLFQPDLSQATHLSEAHQVVQHHEQLDGSGLNMDRVFYEKTLLPNQFNQGRQKWAEKKLEEFEALVDVRCYALMPLFLCSIYAPKCVQLNTSSVMVRPEASGATRLNLDKMSNISGNASNCSDDSSAIEQPLATKTRIPFADRLFLEARQRQSPAIIGANHNLSTTRQIHWSRLVPPCRSMCKEAFRKCTFFLEVLSLELIKPEVCDKFPESSDPNICVGHQEAKWLQANEIAPKCRNDEFRCSTGNECIPTKWRCDGFADCKDKSDEDKCSQCDATSQFYCGQNVCIQKWQVCDGKIDCKDGRDERLCLRLSNNTGIGRLEAWNASSSSWLPVCGSSWQTSLMSDEACRALGYSRAIETLILYGDREANTTSGLARGSQSVPLTNSTTTMRANSFRASYNVSGKVGHFFAHQTNPETSQFTEHWPRSQQEQIKFVDLQSYVDFLFAKNLEGADCGGNVVATVHLKCDNFQCGRSVTSHLLRLATNQQQQQQLPPTVDTLAPVKSQRTAGGGVNETKLALEHEHRAPKVVADDEEGEGGDMPERFDEDDDSMGRPGSGPPEWIEVESTKEQRQLETRSISRRRNSPASARLVVGGVESMPGEFPYLAALHGGPDEVFFCGGVLISANWLLTASHCVGNRTRADGWMVKVGVTRRIASPAFVKKLQVEKIIKHPAFDVGSYLNNDIALILLKQSVGFNQYLRPVCLPAAGMRLGPDNGKECVVVGFGKSQSSQSARYLDVAHFVNVPIIHRSVCSAWYNEMEVNLTEGMLCAGYSEGKRDSCQGDSGSGLFCRYSDTSQFFVAGVVSFGIKCAAPKLPGVYTSVPWYVDWIKETTRKHGHPVD